ncbi:hypothetical protein M427DRAFT_48881 [Gonapodya prolifera JEL478]|uniref:Uncharacterized protein n=1 Tax=Gonapodya prolifera (strain JEL478) TaxID=1344416 RepID=A0A139A0C0_GONPJ|nr:hypothetical protein M427DRAFT_48881 [Gonapodya prolifera JEL478]|eukprot:KXS09985.1 hypothetical protein M427DRAFT_48881 [Gonapodya prolifera JEL478]
MGATCSVHNNTKDTMIIKYKANEFGTEVGIGLAVFLAAVAFAAGSIVVFGFILPAMAVAVVAAEAGVEMGVLGVAAAEGAEGGAVVEEGAKASFQGRKVIGNAVVKPGEAYVSEKSILSLVMTADITLVGKATDGRGRVRAGKLTVWTGPTNNSNNGYNATDCSFEETIGDRVVAPEPTNVLKQWEMFTIKADSGSSKVLIQNAYSKNLLTASPPSDGRMRQVGNNPGIWELLKV